MKKSFLLTPLVWGLLSGVCSEAWAQVDPSTRLLLRTRETTVEDYETSNRYTVKPKSESSLEGQNRRLKRVPKQVGKKYVEDPNREMPAQSLVKEAENIPSLTGENARELEKEEGIGEKLKDVILGEESHRISKYKSVLHPQDKRNNKIEFGLAPYYFYKAASSRYWFRRYQTSGPGIAALARVWFTPFVGINLDYQSSLNSSLRGNQVGSEFISIDQKDFYVGLRSRSYFGLSRKAKSLVFGLDFADHSFNVPSNASQRVSLRSKGLRISLESNLPTSSSQSWMFGFSLEPRLSHEEEKTAIEIKSGTENESSSMGIWFGQTTVFDRKNQTFWRLSHRVETNQFSGGVDTPDPATGLEPEGVTVTEGTTMLQFGFTWGR